MRRRVEALQYVVTVHAEEELDEDAMTVFDLEEVILEGRIMERQKDRETGEWKYLVRGPCLGSGEAVVVLKLSPTNQVVIITAYRI